MHFSIMRSLMISLQILQIFDKSCVFDFTDSTYHNNHRAKNIRIGSRNLEPAD